MILVTAATGQVGRAALDALAAAGTELRALVRDPSAFEAPKGVQVVRGDFDDDTSIAEALEGVAVVLLAGRDGPDSVSQHHRVLAQVRQAGVRHVVKLSAIGASPKSPVTLMREHHEVDEEVRKGPAGWTLLKPHLFMQNLLRAADAVRREGRIAAPMAGTRFPLVDTRDVFRGVAAQAFVHMSRLQADRLRDLGGSAAENIVQFASHGRDAVGMTAQAIIHLGSMGADRLRDFRGSSAEDVMQIASHARQAVGMAAQFVIDLGRVKPQRLIDLHGAPAKQIVDLARRSDKLLVQAFAVDNDGVMDAVAALSETARQILAVVRERLGDAQAGFVKLEIKPFIPLEAQATYQIGQAATNYREARELEWQNRLRILPLL